MLKKRNSLEKSNTIYIFDTETKEKTFLEFDMIGNFTIGINKAWSNNSSFSNYFRRSNYDYLPISDRIKKVKFFCDGMMCVGKIFPTGITIKGKDVGERKYGYIDDTGKVTIPIIYDEVFPFSNGRAKVVLNGRVGIITKDGSFIVEVNDQKILVPGYEWAGKTYDNKAILVTKNGKDGLLNLNCDVITPLEYSLFEMKPYGYMAISLHDERGLTGLIDTDGKIVVDCKYKEFGIVCQWDRINDEEYVYEPSEGYCIIQQTNGKYGFYNLETHEASPCVFEDAKPFSEGLACVQRKGKYGYINHKGETVIDYIFEDAFPFEGNVARVVSYMPEKGNYYALINRKGEFITNYYWRKIRNFHEGFAAAIDGEVHDNNEWTFINKDGKPISDNRYYDVGHFENGKAGVDFFPESGIRVGEKQYQGKMSEDGSVEKKNPLTGSSIVIPPEFQDAGFPKEGISVIKKDGKYGFADESFNIITPVKFTKVESFSNGWGKVWQKNYWASIDKEGKFFGIVPSSDYDLAIKLKKDFSIVEKGNKWGIIMLDGKVLLPIEFDDFKPSVTKYFDYHKRFEKGDFSFIQFHSSTDNAIYCVKSDSVLVGYESITINEEAALVKKDGKYGFIGIGGETITPIVYQAAKPFKSGFASLQKEDKWGLIDMEGNVVLPFVYDRINNNHYEIVCVENNRYELYKIEKGKLIKSVFKERNDFSMNEIPTYDRYQGSYAQDEMEYSDNDIDTIFDGDPDAYWNID